MPQRSSTDCQQDGRRPVSPTLADTAISIPPQARSIRVEDGFYVTRLNIARTKSKSEVSPKHHQQLHDNYDYQIPWPVDALNAFELYIRGGRRAGNESHRVRDANPAEKLTDSTDYRFGLYDAYMEIRK